MRISGALVLLAGSVLVAGASTAAVPGEPAPLPDGVLFVVRSGSPKVLSDRLSALAGEMKTELRSDLLSYILWGTTEAPPPEGVSPDAPLGLALLRHGRDRVPVLLGRMEADSPYRTFLPEIGFVLSDFEGWTFAARETFDLEDFADLRAELIRAVEQPRRHDLEMEINVLEIALQVRQTAEWFLGGFRPSPDGPESVDDLERGIDAFFDTLTAQLEDVTRGRAGLDLGVDGIRQSFEIEPREGSGLAAFLHAEHSAALAPAEWLDGQSPFLVLSGVDFPAVHAYLDPLLEKIEAAGGELMEYLLPLGGYREALRRRAELGRGSSAGRMDFLILEEPRWLQVSTMPLEDEELPDFLLATAWWLDTDHSETPELDVEIRSGYTLYIFRQSGSETGLHYFAKAGDLLVSGEEREEVVRTAKAIISQERPARNAANLLDEGAALQIVLNTEALFTRAKPFLGAEAVAVAPELPPVKMTLQVSGSQATGTTMIPVRLLAEIYRQVDRLSGIVTEDHLEFEIDDEQ